MKVRLIEDFKKGRFWYEEEINGTWVKVPRTDYACPGNSRHALYEEIQKRREWLNKSTTRVVEEEEIELFTVPTEDQAERDKHS